MTRRILFSHNSDILSVTAIEILLWLIFNKYNPIGGTVEDSVTEHFLRKELVCIRDGGKFVFLFYLIYSLHQSENEYYYFHLNDETKVLGV